MLMNRIKENKEKIALILNLKKNGIYDNEVLNEIEKIDRSKFVDATLKNKSNLNIALPIDCGQTISQPLIVALMTQNLDLNKRLRVLEIGTGSGYQTYILSKLSRFVYTVERHRLLAMKTKKLFNSLEIGNIFCKYGDGGLGWIEQAPFDRIIVTACAPEIPTTLISQLKDNGIMIIPIGEDYNQQILKKLRKLENGKISIENLSSVRFVPLVEGIEN